jgi:hypothetical protein
MILKDAWWQYYFSLTDKPVLQVTMRGKPFLLWTLEPAYRVGVGHPHVHRQYGVGPRGVSVHGSGRGYPEQ